MQYGQIIFLGVMLAAVYALLILPQRKKDKETKAMLAALEEGDEVILTSGIHGFVAGLENNVVWLTIAPNVDLKISRSAIAGVLADPAADEDD
jgi:preprotein translocase subunit YajC